MNILPYIHITRPDHWFKNVFMLPGILLAFYFRPDLLSWATIWALAWGFAAACLACAILLFVDLPAFNHLFNPWILPQQSLR